jgi:hypothetical protein
MSVNPDPHKEGYRFNPYNRVTGTFDSCDRIRTVLQQLPGAGFADKDVEVFVGEEGLQKLDFSGEKHGPMVHLLRTLERYIADEDGLYEEAERTLHGGGALVGVLTGDDEAKKTRVADILRANGGHDVSFWGQLTVEKLSAK